MSKVTTYKDCSNRSIKRKASLPKLVLIHSPSEQIENGKNRRKFPSSKDCYVKVGVVFNSESGSKQKRAAIRYDWDRQSTLESNKGLMNGPVYFLGISKVTRHRANEELLDLPTHNVCQYSPLNYTSVIKDHQPDHYGFWFRFFGKSCRFHILITLKLHKPGCEDEVVSAIELNIRNIEKYTVSGNISGKSLGCKSLYCSLYSEKGYIDTMDKLQNLQDYCLWEKCVAIGDEMISNLEKGKSDMKACILLEQSKAACCQGKFVTSKSLVKQALEAIPPKSQNKNLLTSRAYVYLSMVHHFDFSLGNADECLRIASEKLINFKPCEDTGDLHYHEGWLLISFLLKIPNFSDALLVEAQEKLDKAISHYQEAYNPKHTRIINKIYRTQLCKAILFLANQKHFSMTFAEEIISNLSDACLSQEIKCRFSFVKALVLQHQSSYEAAITNAKRALELAKTCGLYPDMQLIVKCLESLKYM